MLCAPKPSEIDPVKREWVSVLLEERDVDGVKRRGVNLRANVRFDGAYTSASS